MIIGTSISTFNLQSTRSTPFVSRPSRKPRCVSQSSPPLPSPQQLSQYRSRSVKAQRPAAAIPTPHLRSMPPLTRVTVITRITRRPGRPPILTHTSNANTRLLRRSTSTNDHPVTTKDLISQSRDRIKNSPFSSPACTLVVCCH